MAGRSETHERPDHGGGGDGGAADTLAARIRAALEDLAFGTDIPAQSRVAALKELRAIQAEDRDAQRAQAVNRDTDPGTLTVDDIDAELRRIGAV